MSNRIGIWLDTKKAFIISVSETNHSIKLIESEIDTREREEGESKKFGRFGNQYMTYEKNRLNKISNSTNQYIKVLLKEIENANEVVLFGPSTMKVLFSKEISNNLSLKEKLKDVQNAEAMTENQLIAWVKDFYNIKK